MLKQIHIHKDVVAGSIPASTALLGFADARHETRSTTTAPVRKNNAMGALGGKMQHCKSQAPSTAKTEVPRHCSTQPSNVFSNRDTLLGNRAFGAGQDEAMALFDLSCHLVPLAFNRQNTGGEDTSENL